ncbi:terminase small subunit [uncultured Fusobacterium sp.]|jgi:phage terminase small subunit|uniref:terminase small subunit n=1 Tax=uncultured Fusobacterium sp. TaxID=159267 RepID=UPI002804529A|nr:terminase small subunit [uncultured Fusobacterium sp.]
MKEKLTPKQKAFCEFYIETGNQTEAAIKAGYSKKTARVIGQENLLKPAIKEYLEKRLAEIDAKRIANADEVLEYLTKVMRGEEKDQFGLEISIQDRTKAAELLGKRYRLFTDKVQLGGTLPVMIVGEEKLEE